MGTVFWGDVVWYSFEKAKRDEGIISDQKYQKQIFWDLYFEDFKFWEWLKKMHIYTAYKNKELIKF